MHLRGLSCLTRPFRGLSVEISIAGVVPSQERHRGASHHPHQALPKTRAKTNELVVGAAHAPIHGRAVLDWSSYVFGHVRPDVVSQLYYDKSPLLCFVALNWIAIAYVCKSVRGLRRRHRILHHIQDVDKPESVHG